MAQAMYFLYRELNKCGLEIRLGLFGLILFFFFGDMVFGLILELIFVLHNVSLEHL